MRSHALHVYRLVANPTKGQLNKGHLIMGHGTAFTLNFFWKTGCPISTEVGRKYSWDIGIQICSN